MTRHKYNLIAITFAALAAVMIALIYALTVVMPAKAIPVVDFKPGRIVEDNVFTNVTSMSVSQIQSFLNSKVPVCDTQGTKTSEFGGGTRAQWAAARGHYPPFTCLKDYSENGRSAAQIIYDTAHQFTINPQVLIVLLQKEQGLVTDTWPLTTQYQTATGYGCPDTAACDTQYYGLTNQLYWAGNLFRSVLDNNPNWYSPYSLGNNYVRWSPTLSCGGGNVYIENRSTQALYDYTPYQPNQAALNSGYGTGDSCSAYGNRNFYLYLRDWFGYNGGPAAYSATGSSTIYVSIEGYKFSVPYMAALQDYGISADSIQTVDQSYVDAHPTPPLSSGYSTSISHVVKSPSDTDEDGGSVYLISRGKRYQFQTMSQFYAFGFKDSDISFLPLSYLFSLSSGGQLSDFVTSPYGNVFKVDEVSKTKKAIFEYSTYIANNPSDSVTPLSYYLTDKIPSGNPIVSRPVMIQNASSDAVSLYQNDTYYNIPDFNSLACWGLNTSALNIPTYRVPQDNYIASITYSKKLSCAVAKDSTNYVLNSTIKYVDTALSISRLDVSADPILSGLLNLIPSSSQNLKSYVKSNDSAAVWYVSGGIRKVVPSYNSFVLLGLNASSVDTVNGATLTSLTDSGILLASGQLVKTPDSAGVYVVSNGNRIAYNSSDIFESYKNNWSNIETYSSIQLDANYPISGSAVPRVLADKTSGKSYIINNGVCYSLSDSTLTAIGTTNSTIATSQPYDASIFRYINLSSCIQSNNFIKSSDSSLVYWLSAGQKHPLTYNAMLNRNNGISPMVMVGDSNFVNAITAGTMLSQ